MAIGGRLVPAHQIAWAAHRAGMRGNDLVTAVAVAYGESDGYERSYYYNTSSGDKSYGLWQINMLGSLHDERLRKYGLSHADELFDIQVNARVMRELFLESQGWGYNGFRPWGAYTNGRYRRDNRWERAVAGVALLEQRLAESGDRLHFGGEQDCDSI